MLMQDSNGHAQPLIYAGNKEGAESELSTEFIFPKLKETTMNVMPDFMAMAQIKGMLVSGLSGFFHAVSSCMLASPYMLKHSCTYLGRDTSCLTHHISSLLITAKSGVVDT